MDPRIRNRYAPHEVVGRGGQGEVIHAIDEQHDRAVAIKIRRTGDEAEREQLLMEARLLLGLKPHPFLPLVREDFFEGDHYYLVMDWVEGENLQSLLDRQGDPGLPFSSTLRILERVAEALDHLHAQTPAIVHGDVKPANIIVGADGEVTLVDFGIARTADAEGLAAGTSGYMAPEIIAGTRPTPASDIFSLAATATALLSGQPPDGAIPDWEGVPARGVGVLQRALRRALSSDPARRPSTATELLDRLRSWLEALPTGTLTFLFTGVEGSSRTWEQEPEAMSKALAHHDAIIETIVEEKQGSLVRPRGEGDSRFAVFRRATDAAAAMLEIQRAFARERWPTSEALKIRAALHTGESELREADYYGPAVNRCARLRSLAHGGQVLLSRATADLVAESLPDGASLLDLGSHRLTDLARPESVFQLTHADLPSEFPPLGSLETRPNNLPVALTSFVGRDDELARVGKLLATDRLVTLTGAGGVGKTRLATHAAAEALEQFGDGVWLAELASLKDPQMIPLTVATKIGLREEPGKPFATVLREYLRSRRTLLVLDNCEHLLEGTRELVRDLLEHCEGLRILATSREPIGVPGEALYQVPSLPVPGEGSDLPLEAIAFIDSVRLFVERASQSKADFTLTDDNASAVTLICTRLDGIPLAIELAAARVRHMTPGEIAERLNDRFRVLTGGAKDVPRHETLRAAIDWSHEMLSEDERTLFARLAIFAGGFTLEAAEQVCGEGFE